MEIYSHKGIEDELINLEYEYTNDYGQVAKFSVAYNKSLVVNMPYVGIGEKLTNEQGWLRDLNYYFDELLLKNPEYFSKKNVERIKNRRSPYCDQTFVNYFPEYNCYIGSKLIHHHIGRDGQVVAVPSDIHVGQGGVHLVEREIGIDRNAINFSAKVAEAVDAGEVFRWEEANQYLNEVSNSTSNDMNVKSDNNNVNDDKDKSAECKQDFRSSNNATNGKKPDFNKLNTEKGVLKKRLEVIGNVIESPTAKVVLGGLALLAASKTPIGKRFIKGASDKLLKNSLWKKIPISNAGKLVNNTRKANIHNATKETIKEFRKEEVREVAKVGLNIGKGVAKSPHIRSAHTRRLASGAVIQVREARIH